MPFQVFENDKPADCFNYKLHPSWDKSKYDTIEEAIEYLLKYFYPYISEWNGTVGKIEFYEGCFAEIKEVKG